MAVYKVTLATKDGERKVKYIYPKTSADIVEYSNNKSVYAKIEELEYLINSIPKFKIRVVSELPTLDISETTVYLVKAQTEDTKNIFSEYIYVNNEWELLGVQTIDLSIYYTIDQINEIVESLMEGINSKADINHIHSNVTPNPNGTAGFMSPEDKSKLDDIANGAQVNTIESIKVNNNAIVPNASDKAVNITVPTKVSSLTNDSKYQTDTQVATAIEELAERTPTLVDTTSDISTLDLYIGQVIMTKGYSSVGDGGGSIYLVSDTEPDVPWFISINDFYIGIEKKDEYSAAELGMFPNDENNTTKFNTLKTGCKCTIKFSAGTYLWDGLLITRDNHLYSFIGTNDKSPYPSYDWSTNHKNYIGSSTFFAPYWNGEGPSAYPHYQSYVMKIGGTIGGIDLYNVGQKDQEGNILCANDEDENNFSNYYFTGFNIKDISFTDAGKYITDSLLIIEYCSCINGNLQFKNSTCQCLKMRNCWEMFFDFISIRSCILPFPTSALWTMEDYTTRADNISALTVNLLDVENFKSTILRISEKANFCASTINMVQIEGSLSQNKEHTLENGDKELALDGNTKTIDNVVYGVQTGNFVDLGKTKEELAKVNATTGLSLYEQGISTYELAIKIPLIDYTNVNAVIINSISLQSVGYQWWYWENDSSVKYVHSLLRGVGGFSIGMIAIDTVFHYFTINDNVANGWARFTDIAMIKCDKTQLIPAPIGGVTYDYRFITNGSTNIFKSTIPVFQGSYPDNTYLKSLVEQCGSATPQLNSYQIGVSTTAANVSAKTVSLSDFELKSGVRVWVKFAYPDNGNSSPTLNINNTGAKPICISHTVIINSETGEQETVIENINAGYLKANKAYQFEYDGTQYLLTSTGVKAIMSIEGRNEVTIVPKTIGVCEKISAIFSKTEANLYVRRYLNDVIINEASFPDSTSYTVRILELARKNYDSYEIVYVPNLSSDELEIINDTEKTKEQKIQDLANLIAPHNLALSYLKIE